MAETITSFISVWWHLSRYCTYVQGCSPFFCFLQSLYCLRSSWRFIQIPGLLIFFIVVFQLVLFQAKLQTWAAILQNWVQKTS